MSRLRRRIPKEPMNPSREALQAQRDLLHRMLINTPELHDIHDVGEVMRSMHTTVRLRGRLASPGSCSSALSPMSSLSFAGTVEVAELSVIGAVQLPPVSSASAMRAAPATADAEFASSCERERQVCPLASLIELG